MSHSTAPPQHMTLTETISPNSVLISSRIRETHLQHSVCCDVIMTSHSAKLQLNTIAGAVTPSSVTSFSPEHPGVQHSVQSGVQHPVQSGVQHSVQLEHLPSSVGGAVMSSVSHYISGTVIPGGVVTSPHSHAASVPSPQPRSSTRKYTPPGGYDNVHMSPHSDGYEPDRVNVRPNIPVHLPHQAWLPGPVSQNHSLQSGHMTRHNGSGRPLFTEASAGRGHVSPGTPSPSSVYTADHPHASLPQAAFGVSHSNCALPIDNNSEQNHTPALTRGDKYVSHMYLPMGGELVTPPPDVVYSPPSSNTTMFHASHTDQIPCLPTSGGSVMHQIPEGPTQWALKSDHAYFPPMQSLQPVMPELNDGQKLASQTKPPPSATSEDSKYTEERMEKLLIDLKSSMLELTALKQHVTDLESQVLKERRNRNANFPSEDDMKYVKEENRKLSINVQLLAHRIDLHGQSQLGVIENETNFYHNIQGGQRGSVYSSLENTSSNLAPLCSTVTSPSASDASSSPSSQHRRTPPPRPPPPAAMTPVTMPPVTLPPANASPVPFRHNPAPPAAVAVPSEEGTEWNCSACTFANHPALNKCEVCEMPRVMQGRR